MESHSEVNDHRGLRRSNFPPGFMFGVATSAYQCEGAAKEGGRGLSIWDSFCQTPGKIVDGSNGDVAVDQYHRYKEDVKLIKDMGVDVYRFSISWSRMFPKGKGEINEEGVAYYNNLINELLENGIQVSVTLFHWDAPQCLEDDYGGFLSPCMVTDYTAYAETCFRLFGDRVKQWITFNEPYLVCYFGYDRGLHAPGHSSFDNPIATEIYTVAHHILLAHAAAVEAYRTKYQVEQKGSIGITLVCNGTYPYSASLDDQNAAQRVIDFTLGWFMDPIISGNYPTTMKERIGNRLPKFTEQQSQQLKGTFDFIGVNYYTSQYAINCPEPTSKMSCWNRDCGARCVCERNGVLIGLKASDFLYVYAPGIKDLLIYIKHQYNNPPIFITENGVNDPIVDESTTSLDEALNDTGRINFCSEHLWYILEAIREGSDIRGFYAWSLMDNFEWSLGYECRFGFHYIDYKDGLKRYPKASSHWYKKLLLE